MEPWMLLLGAACCCFPIAAGLVAVAVWFLVRNRFGGESGASTAETERLTMDLGPTTEVARTPETWRSPPLPPEGPSLGPDLADDPATTGLDDEDDVATVVGPPPPGLLDPSRHHEAEPPRSPASAPPPPPRSSAIHARRPGQTIIAFDDDEDDDDESHEIG